jgi:hypothetical protein
MSVTRLGSMWNSGTPPFIKASSLNFDIPVPLCSQILGRNALTINAGHVLLLSITGT